MALSGTVSGLTTGGLALATNGVNIDINAGATSFTFGPILTYAVGYEVIVALQPSGQACTVANGSGVASTANIANVVVTCSNRTFTVGGTVTGLTGSGLVLANGSDTLNVAAGASSFTMPAGVAYGSSYAVTVATQPAGLTCNVTSGTGTVAADAVTNIVVACSAQPLNVGGTISGVGSATGLKLINGADEYTVPAGATSFTLGAPQSTGSSYAVRVKSQPAGETCSAGNGSGTIPTHDVTDVSIICSAEGYSLGGTVVGLTAAGLVLSDGNQAHPVPAGANDFTMPTAVAYRSPYRVSVETQPAGLTCTVSGGAGTMPASGVADVSVTCASTGYTLGGSIFGLRTSGLVLTDGAQTLPVAANAAQFSMPDALAYGSRYTVTIQAQPDGASCQISQGAGTVTGEVGTVQVTCGARAPR